MNKAELNTALELLEPTNIQKEAMLQHIIQQNNSVRSSKYAYRNMIPRLAAAFLIVLCLSGVTAYASGYLDDILGAFSIKGNFVSWATDSALLIDRNAPAPTAAEPSYDEVYTYPLIEEALHAHNLTIAVPKSKLLFDKSKEVTVRISNTQASITHTNFNTDYDTTDGLVELVVDAYEYSSDPDSNHYMGISTSQHGNRASTYKTSGGSEFTLLKAKADGNTQTVASTMIKADNKNVYLYSVLFTDVSQTDIEDILDSFDMSVYKQ